MDFEGWIWKQHGRGGPDRAGKTGQFVGGWVFLGVRVVEGIPERVETLRLVEQRRVWEERRVWFRCFFCAIRWERVGLWLLEVCVTGSVCGKSL